MSSAIGYYVRRYYRYGVVTHAVDVTDSKFAACGIAEPYQGDWRGGKRHELRQAGRMEQCKVCVRKVGDDW
jgi:hypothetical protein